MKKHLLDRVRSYILDDPKTHPLSPMIVAADLLELKKDQVSVAFWHMQQEGLIDKFLPDGFKHAIWTRTNKALTIIESSQKQAEN